jgi:RNA polymerase sigma-70 factor (ECF subfamily)
MLRLDTSNVSFQQIYIDNYKKVLAFMYQVTANLTLSEDLSQETFIRAYYKLQDFRGDSSVIVWLNKIGYNLFLDFQRKKRLNTVSSDLDEIRSLIVSGKANLELDIDQKLMSECVQSKILTIPKNYRIPLYLDMEGYSDKEIAAILNCSLENAKIRLSRGRKKLKDILAKECSFYHDERNVFCCVPLIKIDESPASGQ